MIYDGKCVTFKCSTPYFHFLTTKNIFFLDIYDFESKIALRLRNFTAHLRNFTAN